MATTINSNTTDGIVITPDTSGEIHLQANGVTKAKVTANGLQDANGASLRGGMYRNLLINGDMRIAQRGTSATGLTTSGYNTVDRFEHYISSFGTWTESQDTDVPSGQGFTNSVKIQCTTAQASPGTTATTWIGQTIEAQNLQHLKYGTSNAEKLTASFWVKSNKTGTYLVWFHCQDGGRMTSKTYTIDTADTWEKKTFTIAGDTSGNINNDNGIGMRFRFVLGSGTQYTSGTYSDGTWEAYSDANAYAGHAVNLADSTSNYINITGIQLEVGEGASDFEFLPYDVQLARCQRYYYKLVSGTQTAFAVGVNLTTTLAGAYIKFPTSMRSAPSGDFTSGTDYYQFERGGGSDPFNTLVINRANTEGCYIYNGSEISGTAGQAGWMYTKDNSAAYIGFSAEL